MTDPTASVYHERDRVWVRMELSTLEYQRLLKLAYHDQGGPDFYLLLTRGEREKTDRSDIFGRFDDNPKIGD